MAEIHGTLICPKPTSKDGRFERRCNFWWNFSEFLLSVKTHTLFYKILPGRFGQKKEEGCGFVFPIVDPGVSDVSIFL